MSPIKWPCDWNRPLSKEELEIAKRLDRAPEGASWRVGEVLQGEPAKLSDERTSGGAGERRGADAKGGVG